MSEPFNPPLTIEQLQALSSTLVVREDPPFPEGTKVITRVGKFSLIQTIVRPKSDAE